MRKDRERWIYIYAHEMRKSYQIGIFIISNAVPGRGHWTVMKSVEQ